MSFRDNGESDRPEPSEPGNGPRPKSLYIQRNIVSAGNRQVIATGPMKFMLSKAVILIFSISILLIFLSDSYERIGRSDLFTTVYYPTLFVMVIALDVHMWFVLRDGGTRVVFKVTCPEDTDYRVRLDGKRRISRIFEYRGPIVDEIRCKRGCHTLSVVSGGSVETAEVDVDEVAFVRIRIHGDIDIEPDDYDWTREPDPRSMEIKAVLLYAAFCFFMTAMTIVTVFFQEIRSGRSCLTLKERVAYEQSSVGIHLLRTDHHRDRCGLCVLHRRTFQVPVHSVRHGSDHNWGQIQG